MDAASIARLKAYFAQIGANLRDNSERASFAMYAFGLLGDGERKSAEAEEYRKTVAMERDGQAPGVASSSVTG